MKFAGFLGNTELKRRLSAAFDSGRASHCYLLCGPEGSGKHTLAGIMAAAYQCEQPNAPCGQCRACRKAFGSIHPDIITIDDPEKRTVSVDLIRQLQADAYIRPNEGRRKVYLLPRAQDMTDSAQNALLKLMEEPPAYAAFLLLTTSAERLLPTVRSRAAELRLEPVPQAEALPWLQSRFPRHSADSLRGALLRCGGFLGQADQLLRGQELMPQTREFAQVFAQKDRPGQTMLLCGMEKLPREKLLELLRQWQQLLADALMARAGIPGTPEAEALARSCTAAALSQAARTVQKAMEYCTANIGTGHICGWLAVSL